MPYTRSIISKRACFIHKAIFSNVSTYIPVHCYCQCILVNFLNVQESENVDQTGDGKYLRKRAVFCNVQCGLFVGK